MDIKPAPDGGLTFVTLAEARFTKQGIFDFLKQLEGVRAKVIA